MSRRAAWSVLGGLGVGALVVGALRWYATSVFGAGRRGASLIVGVGDSVPAGTRAGGTNFLVQLGQSVHAVDGRAITVINFAVPGLTTRWLAWQLLLPGVRDAVRRADLTVVTIGANDFSPRILARSERWDAELARLRRRLGGVLSDLRRTMRGGDIEVTGYWNVFTDGQPADRLGAQHRARSDELTRRVNDTLQAVAREHGAGYVDLYEPFKGDGDRDPSPLLAFDGDHPNADGHAVIADQLRRRRAATGAS